MVFMILLMQRSCTIAIIPTLVMIQH